MKGLLKIGSPLEILKGKILASVFYEPSTRTRCSFAAAMKRLGGEVIEITSEESSVKKGETIEDFARSMECYSDAMVIRSPIEGAVEQVSKVVKKPLINAGDGGGEHPTQAILDMYTIREEVGTTGGICVALVGDLKHSRTVHSLVKLLSIRQNVRLKFVSPTELNMPDELKDLVKLRGVEYTEHTTIEEIIDVVDILYVTRVQRERMQKDLYDKVEKAYQITPYLLSKGKESLRVMHPLPRVSEITKDVDSDPRAAYFRQMQYGLYVRMAILSLLLKK
jgi:carbamoyl-phosphate synthase/aspartate carbamoyltransferase/dihydroorotase